jgi:hypothetical protein
MPVALGEALLPFIAAARILFAVGAGDGRAGRRAGTCRRW